MNTRVRIVIITAAMCLVLISCIVFFTYLIFTIEIRKSSLTLHRQTAGFFMTLLDERMHAVSGPQEFEDESFFGEVVSSIADYYDLESPERIVVFNRDTGRLIYPVSGTARVVSDDILFGTRSRVEGVLDLEDRFGYFVQYGAGPLVIYSFSLISEIAQYRNGLLALLLTVVILFTLSMLLFQCRLLRRWFGFQRLMKKRFEDVVEGKASVPAVMEAGYGGETDGFISVYNRMVRRIGTAVKNHEEKLRDLFKQRDNLKKLVFLYKKHIPDRTLRKIGEKGIEEVVSIRGDVTSLSVEIVDFLEPTRLLYPQVITGELDDLHGFIQSEVRGIINYSRGYAFNIVFGVPFSDGYSAPSGFEAAKKILDWIETRNLSGNNISGINWSVRFGLSHGPAVTGIVGSSYIVVGAVVEKSCEMLRHAGNFDVRLVTDETGVLESSDWKYRMLDKADEGGGCKYEVFLQENEKLDQAIRIYRHGLDMFYENRYDMAVMDFKKVESIFDGDGPSRIFLSRCEQNMHIRDIPGKEAQERQ